jgi:hypothetical protein
MNPTFVISTEELRKRLRLGQINADGDAGAIFDDAMRAVSMDFRRRLTNARVIALQAMASSDSPATDDELLRMTAEVCEVRMIRRELLRRLPSIFVDGGGASQQTWNEEGFTRNAGETDLSAEIERLTLEIDEAFDLLAGKVDVGEEEVNNFAVIGTDNPAFLGDSIGLSGRVQ